MAVIPRVCKPVTGSCNSCLTDLSDFGPGIIVPIVGFLKAGQSYSDLTTACIFPGSIIDMISGSSSLMPFAKTSYIFSEFSTGR